MVLGHFSATMDLTAITTAATEKSLPPHLSTNRNTHSACWYLLW